MCAHKGAYVFFYGMYFERTPNYSLDLKGRIVSRNGKGNHILGHDVLNIDVNRLLSQVSSPKSNHVGKEGQRVEAEMREGWGLKGRGQEESPSKPELEIPSRLNNPGHH